VNVLLPTPPLPDSTRILYFTEDNRCFNTSKAKYPRKNVKYAFKENIQHKIYFYLPGSGSWVTPDAQIFWFGHPWQADTWPADELSVPGQSKNFKLFKL